MKMLDYVKKVSIKLLLLEVVEGFEV